MELLSSSTVAVSQDILHSKVMANKRAATRHHSKVTASNRADISLKDSNTPHSKEAILHSKERVAAILLLKAANTAEANTVPRRLLDTSPLIEAVEYVVEITS